MLQQHLPFTVLKPAIASASLTSKETVATTPTVYGIETHSIFKLFSATFKVATTPTVYGIETLFYILHANHYIV